MSKSTHTLKIQKESTVYTCDLYTTTEEARSNLYPTYPLFRVNINGTNLYAPFTSTLTSSTESTPLICPIFAGNGDNTQYCVAQHSFFAIGITTKSNETITVNAGGQSWTSGTKWFPYGTTWTASVSPSTGWNAGAISPAGSGTLTNASVTVTAGNATHKTYTITLTQKANETVTIHYKNHNGTSLASSWSTTTSSITLGHSSQYYLTIAASTGWNAGSVTNAGSASSPITLTGAVTVAFNAATHKTYTISLTQKTGETLTLHYRNYNGSSWGSWSTTTGSVTLGHGSQYYSTIAASSGYVAGSITNAGSASSPNTLTGAVTIAFGAATAVRTISFTRNGQTGTNCYFNVTYTNSSGSRVTSGNNPSSITIKYNTNIVIKKVNGGNYGIRIYQSGTYKSALTTQGATWTSGNLTANTAFTITGYVNNPQSSGEG